MIYTRTMMNIYAHNSTLQFGMLWDTGTVLHYVFT